MSKSRVQFAVYMPIFLFKSITHYWDVHLFFLLVWRFQLIRMKNLCTVFSPLIHVVLRLAYFWGFLYRKCKHHDHKQWIRTFDYIQSKRNTCIQGMFWPTVICLQYCGILDIYIQLLLPRCYCVMARLLIQRWHYAQDAIVPSLEFFLYLHWYSFFSIITFWIVDKYLHLFSYYVILK